MIEKQQYFYPTIDIIQFKKDTIITMSSGDDSSDDGIDLPIDPIR